ncbi:type II toxin-antitoxin system VapC family toxin [Endozoicomonas sp. ALB115]|uniref:type II toxin-antitoxin system VapC family toxin n=1 Tax=Endozoicomonas sp. ALB115 TaxID=3403074 RepID=UPI003BB6F19B
MNGILIDSSVLLDLLTNDKNWADWSENILEQYSQSNSLFINSMVYTEISIGFKTIEAVDETLTEMGIKVLEMPREALFLAGKVFLQYRKNKGNKTLPLPDFFIGAHALTSNFQLITRDNGKFTSYFPTLRLVTPGTN